MADDVGELARLVARVDGDGDQADAERREERRDGVGLVPVQDPDAISLHEAGADVPAGELVGPRAQLRVGNPCPRHDDRLAARQGDRAVNQAGDRLRRR